MIDIAGLLEGAVERRNWPEVLALFEEHLSGDVTHVSNDVHGTPRTRILEAVFQAQFALGRYNDCEATLRHFETCAVTEKTIRKSNVLFDVLWRHQRGKRIVGTTYVGRERSGETNELTVRYGSFPLDHRALPCEATIYRHALFANDIRHDAFEHDEAAWGSIGIIYILNLSERKDRYYETLLELSRVHAPLDRVHHFRVEGETLVEGNHYLNGSACSTKSHADIVRHFLATPHEYGLIVEDDIAFASDGARVCADLATFFERRYAFAVCLLAASKFHDLRIHDDLLLRSYQECTTAAGYIVPRASAPLLLECFETGAAGIVRTGDVEQFVVDRYWAKLMHEHPFFTFRRKIAYQKPSWSSTQLRYPDNFD